MSSAASVCSLARVASYRVPSRNFNLVISRGSVVEWSHNTQSSAIVNAANEGCLGGGGVDGAIGDAGGDVLFEDRMNLPQLQPGVRCQTGSAVMTGPNSYGSLVNYKYYQIDQCLSSYESFSNQLFLFLSFTCISECAVCYPCGGPGLHAVRY